VSRFVSALVIAVTGALILSGGASSRLQDLTVPVLLEPAAGTSFEAGTPIEFRIQTHAGDEVGYLWLHVSTSPAVVDPCGTIGDDVSITDFTVSATDPSIYEAKPTYYDYSTFWMNTPGTYYWQAYRIEYHDGADGCIESEIRSFTITKPAPPPPPPVMPLAAARLQGEFKIKLAVKATSGIGPVKRGRTYSETWNFTPRCSEGPCPTKVKVSSFYATLGGWSMVLNRSGVIYKRSGTATIVACNFRGVRGPLSVSVRVKKGAWIDDEWRATQITGTFRHSVSGTTSGNVHCGAGMLSATIRGTLSE
jgi:hypothetical protein